MKVLIAILLSLFVSQTIKLALNWNRYRKLNFWVYLEDGGMPSAYATSTVALTTAIFYEDGLSNLFIITALFTLVLLGETMKVKRQQGIQSELMAKFIDTREILRRKFTESIGHAPEQVFAGSMLGFFITSLLYVF